MALNNDKHHIIQERFGLIIILEKHKYNSLTLLIIFNIIKKY